MAQAQATPEAEGTTQALAQDSAQAQDPAQALAQAQAMGAQAQAQPQGYTPEQMAQLQAQGYTPEQLAQLQAQQMQQQQQQQQQQQLQQQQQQQQQLQQQQQQWQQMQQQQLQQQQLQQQQLQQQQLQQQQLQAQQLQAQQLQGYAQPVYAQPGYAQPGFAQTGYAPTGYAPSGQLVYAQTGYAQPVYAQPVPQFAGAAQLQATAAQPQSMMSGTVKTWQASKGYGFISVEGLEADVFFMRTELPPELQNQANVEGHHVAFELRRGSDGRPRGYGLKLIAAAAAAQAESSGPRMEGTIKSFSERHGYGFIMSPHLARDIHFKLQDVPAQYQALGTNLAGKEVTFDVDTLKDGKYRAHRLELMGAGGPLAAMQPAQMLALPQTGYPQQAYGQQQQARAAAPAAAGGSPLLRDGIQLVGTIRMFNMEKSFGFAAVPGQQADIYFQGQDLTPETVALVNQGTTPHPLLPARIPESASESTVSSELERLQRESGSLLVADVRALQ